MEQLFKRFAFDNFFQNRFTAFGRKRDLLVRAFNPLLNPAFLFRVGYMHELHTKGRTIGPLHDFDNLAQRCGLHAHNTIDEDGTVQIGFGKAVTFILQLWVGFFLFKAKWVQIGYSYDRESGKRE